MMSEQYDVIEKEITEHYEKMKGYRALNEPEMEEFHEYHMNELLVQWGDLHKFLGNQVVAHESS